MCNLQRMTKGVEEVARLFSAAVGRVGNAGGDVYPGYPGLVVAGGELRSMTWGFPLSLKGEKGQPLKPKPVNNTAPTSSTASCGATASPSGAA